MINNFKQISRSIEKNERAVLNQKKLEKLKTKLQTGLNNQDSLKDVVKTPSQRKRMTDERLKEKRKQKIDTVQQLMASDLSNDHRWDKLVQEALGAIAKGDSSETYWPRDKMFKYLQCMENFMENLQEYQELSMMARKQLMELHDT
jgi:hypothetical protein